jgi:nucleotide-binding universal stress UspA family protein
MIKDIAAYLKPGDGRDAAAEYAISVAEAFEAHIAGVAFAYEPVIPASVMGGISVDLIESQRSENEQAAKAAIDKFNKLTKRESLSSETRLLNASMAGGADLFGRIARRFDLSIVGQAEPDTVAPSDLVIEAAMFESGRPVVVVPYIQKSGLKLDHVMACWDGSKAAARAIADAMPFLERAKKVELVVVTGEAGKSDELPGVDFGQHLARHNVNVDVKRIARGSVDVRDVILSYAADSGTDFLVMGGYGHSRLREFILGGVTRGILSSMTVPVLMSH